MKVISKNKVLLHNDREGKVEEYVEIRIKQMERDSENKIIHFETKDFQVLNKGIQNESFKLNKNSQSGQECIIHSKKTFAEFKAQKKSLLLLFPTELTGDELDDYILQLILWDDATKGNWYNSEFLRL